MPLTTRRSQYLFSLALFAIILLALILAAVLTDPFTANVP
jgi:hypothetical protein